MKFVAIVFFFLTAIPAWAEEVAITIDDLPFVLPSRTTPSEGLQIVRDINQALAAENVIATGFVIGQQVNSKSTPALEAFVGAGHLVGNHSWSHADYGTLTERQFRREILKTKRKIRRWTGGDLLFRFPYLREGETPSTVAAAKKVLERLNYQNARVTIDNDEWRFNKEYMDALEAGDVEKAQVIAGRYIEHMKERSLHFARLGRQVFGRDIKQVLLIHMNKINADHLPELLAWYRSSSWTFITLEDALSDPIFKAPDSYFGRKGLSHIERVATN